MQLPTEDQLALRAACADVLSAHSTSARIRAVSESDTGFDAALWKQISGLGWTTLAVAESAGGIGGSVSDLALVAAEFGRVLQPSPFVQSAAVAWTLSRVASAPLEAILEGLAAGDIVATWAVSQPGATASIEASPEGAEITLTGSLDYVPDVLAATHLLLEVLAPSGVSLALVPADADGVCLAAMNTLDITRRYSRVRLDAVRIPAAHLLGDASLREDLFHVGVVLQCAESTGIAERLLAMTVTYAGQREQFGKPIGSFQALKHRMADLLIETEGCSAATQEAAEAVQTGRAVSEAVSTPSRGLAGQRAGSPRRPCRSTAGSASAGNTICTCTCGAPRSTSSCSAPPAGTRRDSANCSPPQTRI
jgi:alkylation response protein AidB-like acyl-CoA dehydrogenase